MVRGGPLRHVLGLRRRGTTIALLAAVVLLTLVVRLIAHAVWALKVAVGLGLIVVAFAEKLVDVDHAVAFLHDRPEFNIMREVGLPIGDREFVRIAGAVEVLFGLLIISGALAQVGVFIVGIPINATLFFYGETELAGHLPIYGAMLVLLIYASDGDLRRAVTSLWPPPIARPALSIRKLTRSGRATGLRRRCACSKDWFSTTTR